LIAKPIAGVSFVRLLGYLAAILKFLHLPGLERLMSVHLRLMVLLYVLKQIRAKPRLFSFYIKFFAVTRDLNGLQRPFPIQRELSPKNWLTGGGLYRR
jgi:hypothetical protein